MPDQLFHISISILALDHRNHYWLATVLGASFKPTRFNPPFRPHEDVFVCRRMLTTPAVCIVSGIYRYVAFMVAYRGMYMLNWVFRAYNEFGYRHHPLLYIGSIVQVSLILIFFVEHVTR